LTKGGFYADGVVSGGYNNFNVRRPIKFSTIDRTASSSQDSGQFAAALNVGHDWEVGKFTMGPILGAQYTYVGIAPFTEQGADSLNLRVTQQNANSFRTTLGGRIAYTWQVSEKIALIPEGRMFWLHEFMNNPRTIGAALDAGSGPGFDYLTADPYRDSVFCGAGLTAQFGENLTASAYWNVDFGRPDYLGQAVSLNLGWKF
jgi:outer membrane autotransporter protein